MKYQAATQNNVDLLTWKIIPMFNKEKAHYRTVHINRMAVFLLYVRGVTQSQKNFKDVH